MKRLFFVLIVLVVSGLPTGGAITAQDSPVVEGNLTDECVTTYDAEVDYFPDKIELTDAVNFDVEYFNNYKVVTVNGSLEIFNTVLVQCGTPAPDASEFPEGTQFIEVPTGNLVSFSTTFLPGIAQLGLAEYVVGLDSLLFTSTPEIVERIEAGEIVEVAPNFELNLELVLEAEPEIAITDDFSPDRIAALIGAGVFTAVNTDYLETTPLGRAEWLKYTALFYNREADAEAIYADIVTAYMETVELAASVPEDERPVVLWNTFSAFSDVWSIPGPQTYSGVLIESAGGQIALGEEAPEGSALLSFEAVYDGALDADLWFVNLFGATTLDDLIAQDARYADFAAVENGGVWNNSLDVNVNGGNNYFELGVTNPHLILQDLLAIFHPDLMPDHEFTFFERLEPADSE